MLSLAQHRPLLSWLLARLVWLYDSPSWLKLAAHELLSRAYGQPLPLYARLELALRGGRDSLASELARLQPSRSQADADLWAYYATVYDCPQTASLPSYPSIATRRGNLRILAPTHEASTPHYMQARAYRWR